MNQKQYIRLSIVLAIPTLAFSLYLGQEGIFHPKGQFVQCSVSKAYCSPMINTYQFQSDLHLKYSVGSSDRFLGLYDIDVPMKVYFDTTDNRMQDVSSLVDGKILETSNCLILPQNRISCSHHRKKIQPNFASNGRIEFINPEDEIAFNNIAEEGKSYFKNYTFIRIIDGFGVFLILFTPYLIFSWIIHFIIYGAKIGAQRKRPYQ
ncbi:hypothetical protein [Psychrobacter sp.]|uniref:hypothetical protein n=1 Tax=Psychrobacter sp. TaxID=56811 RepID=UPI003569F49F